MVLGNSGSPSMASDERRRAIEVVPDLDVGRLKALAICLGALGISTAQERHERIEVGRKCGQLVVGREQRSAARSAWRSATGCGKRLPFTRRATYSP